MCDERVVLGISGLVRQNGALSLVGYLHMFSFLSLTRLVGDAGIVILSLHQKAPKKEGFTQ